MFNFESLQGIIRHLLTFGGGYVWTSPDDVQSMVGAAMTLIGLVWSIYDKRNRV